MNNVNLIGRFVHTPELKSTSGGQNVVTFTLAVPRAYVKKGEQRQTDFLDCVAWRNTAEFICKYFKKGQMAAVTGEIQTRSYEDKDGKKRKAVEIQVKEIFFCESRQTQETPADEPIDDFEEVGDLPF